MSLEERAATASTTVREVRSRADLKRFIKYPFARHAENPNWVPPLIFAEQELFNPKKNPFYEHARVQLFLAERRGEVVGRVAAIDDDNHNRTHNDNLLFFGFFEAKDEAAARALFEQVEEWARRLGRDAVRGPANPSMNDGAGFQIDAFDTDPYVMTPYNPPEYPRYAEEAGYRKVKDLYAWRFGRNQKLGERIGRLAGKVRKRYNPTVRFAQMKRFKEEVATIKRLYNEAWEENWGFVRYTDAEFDHLAKELKLIVDPDLVVFVELDGKTVGLALCIPDVNQVLKKARGRIFPSGIIAFLGRKKIINKLRLPILGVLPEYRDRGLEVLMVDELYKKAMPKGYESCECSWVLEDNRPMNRAIEVSGAELYKTFRIFQKDL